MSYKSDPAARWLFRQAETYGLRVVTDPQQKRPVQVEPRKGLITVRPGMEFPLLQWWVSRAVAFAELGPEVVPDFLPRARDNRPESSRRPHLRSVSGGAR